MSDGGGHLALVLMLTLLHMDGCGCICKCVTGFYFDLRFGKKTPTLFTVEIKKMEKIRQRAHVPEMHCASSDATLHPGMHGLTQDEGIISAHLCV